MRYALQYLGEGEMYHREPQLDRVQTWPSERAAKRFRDKHLSDKFEIVPVPDDKE